MIVQINVDMGHQKENEDEVHVCWRNEGDESDQSRVEKDVCVSFLPHRAKFHGFRSHDTLQARVCADEELPNVVREPLHKYGLGEEGVEERGRPAVFEQIIP
mmetsp:Transcript_108459/g.215378  ORF Transcript_108459/g.215378 Transcript_108459/m.215378 type:complete len:102 (-) Transcript_108459:735-1040(-)